MREHNGKIACDSCGECAKCGAADKCQCVCGGGNKKKIVVIGAAIVLAAGGFWGYKAFGGPADPQAAAKAEVERLVGEVGELMLLPEGELPTVATVADKEKLGGQPFFKNAENGDKLLAYTAAMKAILFRESENKIIEVAPIVVQPGAQPGTEQAPEKK